MTDPCQHEQDFGRLFQICHTEIPEMKEMIRSIFNRLEKDGLITKVAIIEENVKDLPCARRKTNCDAHFFRIDEKLSSKKRMALQLSAAAFGGFIGGLTAHWSYVRFVLPGAIENQLPGIVREMLPQILNGLQGG